jgi:hypothetical protein
MELAIAISDSEIIVLNIETEDVIRLRTEEKAWGVVFSPNGELIAVCSDRGTVSLINVNSRTLTNFRRSIPYTQLIGVCFSQDGFVLITGNVFSGLDLYDTKTNQLVDRIVYDSPMRSVCSNPSNSLIAAEFANGVLRVWDTETITVPVSWSASRSELILFSPDGTIIVTKTMNRIISFHKIGDDDRTYRSLIVPGVVDFDFSPDSSTLLMVTGHGLVVVYSIPESKILHEFAINHRADYVRYSPEGSIFVVMNISGNVYVYDAITRIYLKSMKLPRISAVSRVRPSQVVLL